MLSTAAHAVPYAFAGNQIQHLTLQLTDGTTTSPFPVQIVNGAVVGATTQLSDSAQFTPYANSGFLQPGVAGLASNVNQAFSGPGVAPAENTFNPAGPMGTFTGIRSDASIGAGAVSTGGVAVSNVAEGYGYTPLGVATGGNTATINFAITLATSGLSVLLDFQNLYNLIVHTDNVGDTATASITNSFSITNKTTGQQVFSYGPFPITQQISSQNGSPLDSSTSNTFNASVQSIALAAGSYNVSLSSSATATIIGQPIPEPTTLALLGAGLLALGFSRKRRPV